MASLVGANMLAELPGAWDSALNLLIESGGVRHFDIDPYLLTYSE